LLLAQYIYCYQNVDSTTTKPVNYVDLATVLQKYLRLEAHLPVVIAAPDTRKPKRRSEVSGSSCKEALGNIRTQSDRQQPSATFELRLGTETDRVQEEGLHIHVTGV
jgi:hypothetical protein